MALLQGASNNDKTDKLLAKQDPFADLGFQEHAGTPNDHFESLGFTPEVSTGSNATKNYSELETGLEHGANSLAFGYLPQIVGGYKHLTGDDDYTKARDAEVSRLQEQEKENPKSALAGKIGGGLVGALALPGIGEAGGIASAIGKGAMYGAAQGALGNPGDTQGKIDPLQLQERGQNALRGSAVGAATAGAGGAVKGLLGKVAESPETLEGVANASAFKGGGAMLKDFRTKDVQDIGAFMREKGLIKAGDTFDDVANKAEVLRQQSGDRLSDIYEKAVNAANSTSPETKEKAAEIVASGFSPYLDKAEILSQVGSKLKNEEGKRSAMNAVSNYMDELTQEHGQYPLDPKSANDVKSAVNRTINYARNPLTQQPDKEKAFAIVRDYVNDKVKQGVNDLGKLTGDNDLKQDLLDANRDYGYSKAVTDMAKDKTSRESANRMFGLTDTIAGVGGAAAGAGVGAMTGHDLEHTGKGAAVGLLAGLANKGARTYGPGILSSGAAALGQASKYSAAPLAQAVDQLLPNAARIGVAGSQTDLRKKQLEKR